MALTAEEIQIIVQAQDLASRVLADTEQALDDLDAAAIGAENALAQLGDATAGTDEAVEATGEAAAGTAEALDETSTASAGAEASLQQLASAAGINVGVLGELSLSTLGVAAAAGAMAAALINAAQAAAEEEAGILRLQASVTATGAVYDDYAAEIEGAIAAGEELAFSDDALRESLSRLTQQTQDVTEALRLQAIAEDLARGAGMDLVSASELLGRVAEGNVGILKRYGIVLDEDTTATEALDEISRRFAGQSQAYAATAAGSWEAFGVTLDNLNESIGAGLLPAMLQLGEAANDAVDALNQAGAIDATATALEIAAEAVIGYYNALGDLTELLFTPALLAADGFNAALGEVTGQADPAGDAIAFLGEQAGNAAGLLDEMADQARRLRDEEAYLTDQGRELTASIGEETDHFHALDDATSAAAQEADRLAEAQHHATQESLLLISSHDTLTPTLGESGDAISRHTDLNMAWAHSMVISAQEMAALAAEGLELAASIDESGDAFLRLGPETEASLASQQALYDQAVDDFVASEEEKARAAEKAAEETARAAEKAAQEAERLAEQAAQEAEAWAQAMFGVDDAFADLTDGIRDDADTISDELSQMSAEINAALGLIPDTVTRTLTATSDGFIDASAAPAAYADEIAALNTVLAELPTEQRVLLTLDVSGYEQLNEATQAIDTSTMFATSSLSELSFYIQGGGEYAAEAAIQYDVLVDSLTSAGGGAADVADAFAALGDEAAAAAAELDALNEQLDVFNAQSGLISLGFEMETLPLEQQIAELELQKVGASEEEQAALDAQIDALQEQVDALNLQEDIQQNLLRQQEIAIEQQAALLDLTLQTAEAQAAAAGTTSTVGVSEGLGTSSFGGEISGQQGGQLYTLPEIPEFALGGTVPGPVGAPQLAMVHGGETITPAGRGEGGMGSGSTYSLVLNIGSVDSAERVREIEEVVTAFLRDSLDAAEATGLTASVGA